MRGIPRVPAWVFDAFQAAVALQGLSIFVLLTGGLIENETATKIANVAADEKYGEPIDNEMKALKARYAETVHKDLTARYNDRTLIQRFQFWRENAGILDDIPKRILGWK